MSLSLLSRLWLAEPGPPEIARALELPAFREIAAAPDELALAWADLFLLGVYPYGSVFCETTGELNGESSRWAASVFERNAYAPPELSSAAAADHAGLCLEFLAAFRGGGGDRAHLVRWLAAWLPVCCVAIEREPGVHPFYAALARETVEAVSCQLSALSQSVATSVPADSLKVETGSSEEAVSCQLSALSLTAQGEEVSLSDIVRFLLAPARSGLFLSRARLGVIGRSAGLPLAFGGRFDVARALFAAAGESGRLQVVLEALDSEAGEWRDAYRGIAARHPGWQQPESVWSAGLDRLHAVLADMRREAVALEVSSQPEGFPSRRSAG